MSELVPAEAAESPAVVDPMSGELVDITDLRAAAEFLERLRQSKQMFDAAIRQVSDALAAEFERQGTRTINAGAYDLEQKETAGYEWDEEEAQKLLDAGLPPERYAELAVQTVVTKFDQRVARQLETNPAYREIIERARRRVVKSVRVDVRPSTRVLEP